MNAPGFSLTSSSLCKLLTGPGNMKSNKMIMKAEKEDRCTHTHTEKKRTHHPDTIVAGGKRKGRKHDQIFLKFLSTHTWNNFSQTQCGQHLWPGAWSRACITRMILRIARCNLHVHACNHFSSQVMAQRGTCAVQMQTIHMVL